MRTLTVLAVVSLVLAVAWVNLLADAEVPDATPEVVPGADPVVPAPIDAGPDLDDPPETESDVVTAAADGPGQETVDERPVEVTPIVVAPTVGPDRVGDETVVERPVEVDVEVQGDPVAAESEVEDVPEPEDTEVVDVVEPETEPETEVDPELETDPEIDLESDPGTDPGTDAAESDPVEAAAPVEPTGQELLGRVLTTGGDTVPSVQVLMTDLDGDGPSRLLPVDVDGGFAAVGVEPGRYSLSVAPRTLPRGLARPAAPGVCRIDDDPAGFGSVCVDLVAGADVATTELVLPFSSVVAGNVVGQDGRPVRDAIVSAYSLVDRFRGVNEVVRTDVHGRFALTLVPGPYELEVRVAGSDGAPDRIRTRRLEADEGTIHVLDAIDTSPPPVVAVAVSAPEDVSPITPTVDAATLEGRVVTRWGEPVEGVEVACVSRRGVQIGRALSDATGTYAFENVPVGRYDVVALAAAPDADVAAPNRALLSEPAPLSAEVAATSERAVAGDLVVEVERVFRVAGRIEIDPESLDAFKEDMLERDPAMMTLPEYRFRRAYLRGLRLTVRPVDSRRVTARPVRIDDDGGFEWACPLPAGDFVFVLEPRSERLGAQYPSAAIRPISPTGVRTAEVVFEAAGR